MNSNKSTEVKLLYMGEWPEIIKNKSVEIPLTIFNELEVSSKSNIESIRYFALFCLGLYYERISKFELAIQVLEIIPNSRFSKDFFAEARYYFARVLYIQNKVHMALPNFQDIYSHLKIIQNDKLYYETRLLEGQCYSEMSMYHEAMFIFHEITQQEIRRFPQSIFMSYISIGNIYKYQRQFEEGMNSYHQAEKILQSFEEELSPNAAASLYKHRSDLLRRNGNFKEAYKVIAKALKIKTTSLSEQIPILNSLAACELLLKNYNQADKIWYEMLDNKSHPIEINTKIIIHIGLADCQIEQGNIKKGYDLLSSVEKDLKEVDTERLIIAVYSKLYEYTKKLNLKEKVLYYLEKKVDIERKIQDTEMKRKVESIKAIHQLELERKQNEILKIETDLSKQKLDVSLMLLDQKNIMLGDLEIFINKLKHDNSQKRKILSELSRKISDTKKSSIQETQIELNLNESQIDYINLIRKKYPSLTHNEAKIAFYISKHLSSKEIAEIHVSEVKTIEQYRYRIRKKLGLKRNDNLDLNLGDNI